MNTDKKSPKTDDLIQASLVKLLETNRFDKITIKDICDEALIGRSTFYNHYVDKYELLDKMIDEMANKFQDLINSRNKKINDDSFLVYLYQELFVCRQEFLILLDIKSATGDLENQIKEILKENSRKILGNTQIDLPADFLTDLYAANAMTAIIWTLKNGYSDEVATFMNDSFKQLV